MLAVGAGTNFCVIECTKSLLTAPPGPEGGGGGRLGVGGAALTGACCAVLCGLPFLILCPLLRLKLVCL